MVEVIDIDIYLTCVVFLVEVTPEEFDRFYYDNTQKLTDDEYKLMREDIVNPDSCGGFTFITGKKGYVVYLRDGKSDLYVPHELYHVVNRILMDRGVEHTKEDESYAYLLGWLTNEFYNRYWKWKDKKE